MLGLIAGYLCFPICNLRLKIVSLPWICMIWCNGHEYQGRKLLVNVRTFSCLLTPSASKSWLWKAHTNSRREGLSALCWEWWPVLSSLLRVQFSSVAQLCPTLCNPWTAACQASLSITNSRTLLKPMSIESVMPSSQLILCHPLLLLPSREKLASSYLYSFVYWYRKQDLLLSQGIELYFQLPENSSLVCPYHTWSLIIQGASKILHL